CVLADHFLSLFHPLQVFGTSSDTHRRRRWPPRGAGADTALVPAAVHPDAIPHLSI
ncbi:unnamed protein product, partial [Gulo gulo]